MPIGIAAADFIAEARELSQLPAAGPPEIAFAGRSNVGKSTLLNRLAGRRALAHVSKAPGRTRGVIFFDVSLSGVPGGAAALRFVDLPGYGYARVAKAERHAWGPLIEGYARSRPTLALFLILLDARRAPGAEDRQMIDWLRGLRVPFRVVMTKLDKLGAAERGTLLGRARHALGDVPTSLVSAEGGDGVDDLLRRIVAAACPPAS